MGSEEEASSFFARWGDADLPRVSDPQASLYESFGLRRGSLGEIFKPSVWKRGFEAAILNGFGVGRMVGDGFRMPGVFLIYQGRILKEFRHETPAERPDYRALAYD
jgi:hypothetical protein